MTPWPSSTTSAAEIRKVRQRIRRSEANVSCKQDIHTTRQADQLAQDGGTDQGAGRTQSLVKEARDQGDQKYASYLTPDQPIAFARVKRSVVYSSQERFSA